MEDKLKKENINESFRPITSQYGRSFLYGKICKDEFLFLLHFSFKFKNLAWNTNIPKSFIKFQTKISSSKSRSNWVEMNCLYYNVKNSQYIKYLKLDPFFYKEVNRKIQKTNVTSDFIIDRSVEGQCFVFQGCTCILMNLPIKEVPSVM